MYVCVLSECPLYKLIVLIMLSVFLLPARFLSVVQAFKVEFTLGQDILLPETVANCKVFV